MDDFTNPDSELDVPEGVLDEEDVEEEEEGELADGFHEVDGPAAEEEETF
jgi:hypothetical protein